MAAVAGVGDVDGDLAVVEFAGGTAILAGDADALGAALGEGALVEDEDTLVAAEFVGDPGAEFVAKVLVGPGGGTEEDLGHAHLGGVAVDLEGDGFGGLVVVVVQEQAAEVGMGAVGAAVRAEQGGEMGHEGVEQRQGLLEVGGGHGGLAGWARAGKEQRTTSNRVGKASRVV